MFGRLASALPLLFGQANESWYFPIADSLSYYGASTGFNVSLWR